MICKTSFAIFFLLAGIFCSNQSNRKRKLNEISNPPDAPRNRLTTAIDIVSMVHSEQSSVLLEKILETSEGSQKRNVCFYYLILEEIILHDYRDLFDRVMPIMIPDMNLRDIGHLVRLYHFELHYSTNIVKHFVMLYGRNEDWLIEWISDLCNLPQEVLQIFLINMFEYLNPEISVLFLTRGFLAQNEEVFAAGLQFCAPLINDKIIQNLLNQLSDPCHASMIISLFKRFPAFVPSFAHEILMIVGTYSPSDFEHFLDSKLDLYNFKDVLQIIEFDVNIEAVIWAAEYLVRFQARLTSSQMTKFLKLLFRDLGEYGADILFLVNMPFVKDFLTDPVNSTFCQKFVNFLSLSDFERFKIFTDEIPVLSTIAPEIFWEGFTSTLFRKFLMIHLKQPVLRKNPLAVFIQQLIDANAVDESQITLENRELCPVLCLLFPNVIPKCMLLEAIDLRRLEEMSFDTAKAISDLILQNPNLLKIYELQIISQVLKNFMWDLILCDLVTRLINRNLIVLNSLKFTSSKCIKNNINRLPFPEAVRLLIDNKEYEMFTNVLAFSGIPNMLDHVKSIVEWIDNDDIMAEIFVKILRISNFHTEDLAFLFNLLKISNSKTISDFLLQALPAELPFDFIVSIFDDNDDMNVEHFERPFSFLNHSIAAFFLNYFVVETMNSPRSKEFTDFLIATVQDRRHQFNSDDKIPFVACLRWGIDKSLIQGNTISTEVKFNLVYIRIQFIEDQPDSLDHLSGYFSEIYSNIEDFSLRLYLRDIKLFYKISRVFNLHVSVHSKIRLYLKEGDYSNLMTEFMHSNDLNSTSLLLRCILTLKQEKQVLVLLKKFKPEITKTMISWFVWNNWAEVLKLCMQNVKYTHEHLMYWSAIAYLKDHKETIQLLKQSNLTVDLVKATAKYDYLMHLNPVKFSSVPSSPNILCKIAVSLDWGKYPIAITSSVLDLIAEGSGFSGNTFLLENFVANLFYSYRSDLLSKLFNCLNEAQASYFPEKPERFWLSFVDAKGKFELPQSIVFSSPVLVHFNWDVKRMVSSDVNSDNIFCLLRYLSRQKISLKTSRVDLINCKKQIIYDFLKISSNPCKFKVDENNLLESSLDVLSSWKVRSFNFKVKYLNQKAVDFNGVTRDLLSKVSSQLISTFFIQSSSHESVPNLSLDPQVSFPYLRLFGILIGMALKTKNEIYAPFVDPLFKLLVGQKLDRKDIKSIDTNLWNLIELPHITFELDFTYRLHGKPVDLLESLTTRPPNIPATGSGSEVLVTDSNFSFYKKLLRKYFLGRLNTFSAQIVEGLSEIIPLDLIKIFTPEELKNILNGSTIDVADWKDNTIYENCSQASDQIVWFWEIVNNMSDRERANLLKFVHGSPFVPLNGFKHLMGSEGEVKFMISLLKFGDDGFNIHNLPTASTCFNILRFPPYQSKEQLKEKLLLAISETTITEQ